MLDLYGRIKERRQELQLSQEELAKRLGYKSRSSINKIEKGLNDISQSKIVEIAKALQTTPEWLMGWSDKITNGGGALVEVNDNGDIKAHKIRSTSSQISDLLNNIPEIVQLDISSKLQNAPQLFIKNLRYIFTSADMELYDQLCELGCFSNKVLFALFNPRCGLPTITPTNQMLTGLSKLTGYSASSLMLSDLEADDDIKRSQKLSHDMQHVLDMYEKLSPSAQCKVLEFTQDRYSEEHPDEDMY